MNKNSFKMTIAQFAKLHEVNKRTLHYYDSIGLFSPHSKGKNNYRYYDTSQSIEFEYILMLKELNMSIDEIKSYLKNPNPKDFIEIVDKKSCEIEYQIEKLKQTKKLLQDKKEQIIFCENELDMDIHIIQCKQEKFLTVPFSFEDDTLKKLFSYIKNIWGIEQCRAGVGSYISVDKIKSNNFEEYDGLFTPILNNKIYKDILIRPKGKYLCGYIKGTWDKIPKMYTKMINFAKVHHLELTGYAYERGINDFVINNENDYITQIMIKIQ